jgi:serine/threonine protein kinase
VDEAPAVESSLSAADSAAIRGPLPPGTVPLVPGDPSRVGEYRLLARFSSGDSGSVYLAAPQPHAQRQTSALAVLKLAHARPAGGNRVRRNFADAAGARMPTPYVAKVLCRGSHDGVAYLVREYVDGMTLAQLVEEDGRLDPVTLNAVAVAAASAILAIHDAGETHGNLKPTNVLVTLAGVRLLDHCLGRQSGQPRADTASDVLGWGRLVAFAGTGHYLATPAAEASLDVAVLDKPIGPLVERALTTERELRPSARALLLGMVSPVEAGGTGARWRRKS